MKTTGIIDIGTNSVRLAVYKLDTNHDYNIIAATKETVRLGEGEFAHNRITRPAMERGILVLKKFAEIARKYKADEIVAVATAAVREAQNKTEFVDRAKSEAKLDVRVISGLEEARLIYLGIVNGVEMNASRGLFVDIGGGTTELIVGDANDYSMLESLKLGAIRMTELFVSSKTGPVGKKTYKQMLDYVHGAGAHAFRKIRDERFDIAFGSSGTIMNLAEITIRRKEPPGANVRNYVLNYADLTETIDILCGMDVEERRKVPGINPERADIIIGGAAIIDAVMTGAGANSITISDRALRDGVFIDHLFQEERVKETFLTTSVRKRSILQLGRSCRFQEEHARKVEDLSVKLFRQLGEIGMHSYGEEEEELLRYGAMMHDIGTFVSYVDHHKHSYYLIKNWSLVGFNDKEVEIIAAAALCHRKLSPKKAYAMDSDTAAKRLIEVLAAILRIADALDRSQLSLVDEILCRYQRSDKRMVLEVYASEDCPLEMWAVESKKRLFEQSFEVDLSLKRIVTTPES